MCIYTNITNTMQFMFLQLYYIRIHIHFICIHGKCLVFARLRNDGGGSLKIIIILLVIVVVVLVLVLVLVVVVLLIFNKKSI